MKKRIGLCYKESGGKFYYYLNFGLESYGAGCLKLWINRSLIREEEIEFPARNSCVEKTLKGNYVLRKKEGYTTFDIFVQSEFMGKTQIEILTPKPKICLNYFIPDVSDFSHYFLLPKRFSSGMIVTVEGEELVYKWHKWNRNRKKTGVIKVTANGEEMEIIK